MIEKALTFLKDFLSEELKMSLALESNSVIGSSLINPDGSVVENTLNKVVVTVINMEHETYVKSQNYFKKNVDNSYGKLDPSVHLNLYLLITSNHTDYMEAFKRLSAVITSLQSNPYFTKESYPTMPDPLTRLTLEIFNIPITELSHIWSGIGAKYVPSIIYKARMITLQGDRIKKETPAIKGLGTNTKAK